jgi:DNA repair protein RecN (Recombination protein N)
MLILKTNIAPSPYPRTLVFDEIDTGIGGRVADAVGIRLKKLAKSNQVICVTHQAQIARYADTHLLVAKETKGQRTLTWVRCLALPERIEELARMMAGASVTEVTRQHAAELLQS